MSVICNVTRVKSALRQPLTCLPSPRGPMLAAVSCPARGPAAGRSPGHLPGEVPDGERLEFPIAQQVQVRTKTGPELAWARREWAALWLYSSVPRIPISAPVRSGAAVGPSRMSSAFAERRYLAGA